MQGYIKDYRKELESDVWSMPPLYHRIWQWLKYSVNHEPNYIPMRDGTKLLIDKGQRLTSLRQISRGVGYYEKGIWKEPNPKTVKSVVDWLEANNMILVDNGNRQYTLITLINWHLYQSKEDEGNSKETLEKQSVDTNKNDKNEKNDKKLNNKKHYADFVLLEEDEYKKLITAFGESKTADFIQRLNNYIGSKGKKYKSHYHTILQWERKDIENRGVNNGRNENRNEQPTSNRFEIFD